MGANSKIQWTTHTFNHIRGCTKVSSGCDHCYAETMSKRNPKVLGVWGPEGARAIAADDYWDLPLRWNKAAAAAGERHRVFCASLGDVFEGPETMPESEWPKVEAARARLWALIEQTPNLDWLLLTKRPHNIRHMVPQSWLIAPRHNVWYGASIESQDVLDERATALLSTPGRVHFFSCEPLLSAIDIRGYRPKWIIAGGESGAGARPCQPQWARGLRDQATEAGIPYFWKQWGEWAPVCPDTPMPAGKARELMRGLRPDGTMLGPEDTIDQATGWVWRAGKAAAGRLLDGRTWDEVPG